MTTLVLLWRGCVRTVEVLTRVRECRWGEPTVLKAGGAEVRTTVEWRLGRRLLSFTIMTAGSRSKDPPKHMMNDERPCLARECVMVLLSKVGRRGERIPVVREGQKTRALILRELYKGKSDSHRRTGQVQRNDGQAGFYYTFRRSGRGEGDMGRNRLCPCSAFGRDPTRIAKSRVEIRRPQA